MATPTWLQAVIGTAMMATLVAVPLFEKVLERPIADALVVKDPAKRYLPRLLALGFWIVVILYVCLVGI
jgi:hypothetical protein